jgi:PAS domain S-box-containing protein
MFSNVQNMHSATLSEKNDERFGKLFHYSPAGSAIVSFERFFLCCNQSLATFLRYSKQELVGKSLEDVTHPADRTLGAESMRAMMNNEMEFDRFEKRYITKEGATVWGDLSITLIRDEHGAPSYFLAIVMDITERKRSERLNEIRLQLSEASYTHTLDELIQTALDAAEDLTESAIGFFHFVEPDQANLTLQMWSTNTMKHMCKTNGKGQHYPIQSAGVWVEAFYARKPVIHNDYQAIPNKKNLPEGHAPVIRQLVVPVCSSKKVVALLGVGNKKQPYNDADIVIVDRLASLIIDIVSRKKAEEILHETDEIVNAIPSGLFVYRYEAPDKLFFLRANPAAIAYTKHDPQKLVGLPFDEVWPNAKEAGITNRFLEAMHSGKPYITESANYSDNKVSGAYKIVAFRISNDRLGVGFEDVTERLRFENELRDSEERYRNLVNILPDGVVIHTDGEVMFANESGARILGASEPAALIGMRIFDLIHVDFQKLASERMSILSEFGSAPSIEQKYKGLNGEIVEVEVTSTQILFHNKRSILDVFRDIGERKKAERDLLSAKRKAEEANIAKSLFLANMSHELRTPMHGIISSTDLLGQMNPSTEAQEIQTYLSRSANNMMVIINDLLDFARIDLGAMKIELRPFKLRSLISHIRNTVMPITEEKALELRFDIPTGLPDSVVSDPVRIEQVLLNLLNNAVKFTNKGFVRMAVEYRPSSHAQSRPGSLVFRVSDSGIGIPQDQQPKIFDRFYQVDMSHTRAYSGVGLGLTISKNIAELLNGTIVVESEPEKGSCFTFTCEVDL